jgi:hypothetical protein
MDTESCAWAVIKYNMHIDIRPFLMDVFFKITEISQRYHLFPSLRVAIFDYKHLEKGIAINAGP